MATDTATATMTTERMLDFFNAWNHHDIDRITTFFTPDGAYYASIGAEDDGSAFRGQDEVRRGVAAFLDTYGDAHYTDAEIIIAGDRGFATWTFHGTDRSGSQITYRGVDIFTFVGDQIRLKDAFRKERSKPLGS